MPEKLTAFLGAAEEDGSSMLAKRTDRKWQIIQKSPNRITTPKNRSLQFDFGDDFRSGCQNIIHQQQFFSELL